MFTGWFHYNYLPNENPYDSSRFEIVKSHTAEVGTEGLQSAEIPDVWRNKETGEVFSAKQFSSHQTQEAWRAALTAFVYGLIGCVYFAITYSEKGEGRFLYGLRNALLVNIVASAIFFMVN